MRSMVLKALAMSIEIVVWSVWVSAAVSMYLNNVSAAAFCAISYWCSPNISIILSLHCLRMDLVSTLLWTLPDTSGRTPLAFFAFAVRAPER